MVSEVDDKLATNSRDSMILSESKKLLSSISIMGGQYNGEAFESQLDINFNNKDENAIFTIMDYGIKINDANKLSDDNIPL